MRYFPGCSAVVAIAFFAGSAAAQQQPKGGSRGVELDAPAPSSPAPVAPPPKISAAPTTMPNAGLVEADRLFEERRWAEAAVVLHRVLQAPGLPAERDLAQYHLAIALARLKLHQAAFGIFAEIADKPLHLKHRETLLWLERIATALPEAADVVETIGKYDEAAIDALGFVALPSGIRQITGTPTTRVAITDANRPQEAREVTAHLYYLLGRYKYRNRQYEDAIHLFGKVPSTSAYFAKAQFISGISHVQLRMPVPAVRAFGRIVHAIEDGPTSTLDAEESRMRDLAFLSSARTYYSASVHLNPDGSTAVDDVKLNVAVKFWDRVDAGGELGLDALFEQSWAFALLGDYTRALGNIHTLNAPFFPKSYYPEAEVLKAGIYLATCHDGDAETLVARFKQKYEPMRAELAKLVMRLDGGDEVPSKTNAADVGYGLLKDVRDGRSSSSLPASIRSVAEITLTDRELLRHVQYVQLIDNEQKRLASMPAWVGPLMDDVRDGLQLSRDLAIQLTMQLARARTQERLDELQTHLRTSTLMLREIAERRRGSLGSPQGIGSWLTPRGATGTKRVVLKDTVQADDEHVLWPFTGEYWRDELGLYRQTITTKCGR